MKYQLLFKGRGLGLNQSTGQLIPIQFDDWTLASWAWVSQHLWEEVEISFRPKPIAPHIFFQVSLERGGKNWWSGKDMEVITELFSLVTS
jgi:hypothetical protein